MSVISSHVMFIDSRASAGRRDSVLVNCMTGAPIGCQIRVSMLEFSAPAGCFGTENTVYLRMLGASLSARESEGLSLPPGQQKNEDHLNPSSILAKIPVVEGKAVQFQSPFLLFSSNSLTSHNLGHFTLQVGDAEGTPFGDLVESVENVWEPGDDGASAAHFSTALRVEIVQISNGDGGGELTEMLGGMQHDFLAGVHMPPGRTRQYAA